MQNSAIVDTYPVSTPNGKRWIAKKTVVIKRRAYFDYHELPGCTARYKTESAARCAALEERWRPGTAPRQN